MLENHVLIKANSSPIFAKAHKAPLTGALWAFFVKNTEGVSKFIFCD